MFTDDELDDAYDRGYACGECHLLYAGRCPWDERHAHRPCPHCGATMMVMATDTLGFFYWEQSMATKHGPDFFKEHYWFSPEWVSGDQAAHYRKQGVTEGAPPKKES